VVTDRGKPNYSERNLPQCHFVHEKSTEMLHELPREPAGASVASALSSGTLLLACVRAFVTFVFLSRHHFN
jgi:hypothetical protein